MGVQRVSFKQRPAPKQPGVIVIYNKLGIGEIPQLTSYCPSALTNT